MPGGSAWFFHVRKNADTCEAIYRLGGLEAVRTWRYETYMPEEVRLAYEPREQWESFK